jgi:DNA-binding NtrC family response regulator
VYSLLGEYSYPGNVRELQSMIYDAVSCAVNHVIPIEGIRKHISGLHPASHPPAASAASSAASHIVFPATLPSIKQATRELIFEALRRTNNNQSLAAEMLQITPSALSQRLRKMKNRDTAP